MKCENCIHKDICELFDCQGISEESPCSFFKDKNKFIELPCKVGDKVYAYCDVFHRVLAYFVEQVIIDYSDINEVLITFNANCTENYELMDSIDFVREDIGKTVFLTREEAEKALKEREQK